MNLQVMPHSLCHLYLQGCILHVRCRQQVPRKYWYLPVKDQMIVRLMHIDFRTSYLNPYPTAFPYGNGMVLHFYQQQESSTTKTVHKVINKGLKTYV